jgi:hypothetical protein
VETLNVASIESVEITPRIPEEFELVYQGGHHNVYCDGKYHIKTGGGWAPTSPYAVLHIMYVFRCDCTRWANVLSGLPNPFPEV